jgi:hypothetical protein
MKWLSDTFCNYRRTAIYEIAGSRIRPDDLLITNQLLYQLSYAGEGKVTKLKRKRQKAIVTFAPVRPTFWSNLFNYSRTREYAVSGSAVSRFLITVLR